MTEYSYYWDGLVTGDAVIAPYSAIRYTNLWKKIFTTDNNQGIINEYKDELEVSGISGGVVVAKGAALVEGYFYENTTQETITIPTPVTDPRIDRIVLRKDPVAQTVRIYRIAGTEDPAPTAPSLTQTTGGVFEIPLAQVLITATGVITVTDERERGKTPLISPQPAMVEIETIVTKGGESSLEFLNIPQAYNHLKIIASTRVTGGSGASYMYVYFNGDAINTHYYRQRIGIESGPVLAIDAENLPTYILGTGIGVDSDEPVGWSLTVLNYLGIFYKMLLQSETSIKDNNFLGSTEGSMWLNTDPVDQITFLLSEGTFQENSVATLVGLI
jgi:hypothetical protein